MNKAAHGLLPVLWLAALISASCKTAEFGFKVIDINGMVYDFSNRPVPNYEVALGRKYKSSTDINGRFTLSRVPIGNYTITGHKSGFEDYSDEVIIKEKGQIIYIRIPSQNQLLNMIDEALTGNNFILAEEMAERAYQIDNNNIEMLFYCAAAAFRQHNYRKAFSYLEAAKNLGSKDLYIEKFLTVLKELQNE
jgi:tetratricopeptide (TPR) repeat protein